MIDDDSRSRVLMESVSLMEDSRHLLENCSVIVQYSDSGGNSDSEEESQKRIFSRSVSGTKESSSTNGKYKEEIVDCMEIKETETKQTKATFSSSQSSENIEDDDKRKSDAKFGCTICQTPVTDPAKAIKSNADSIDGKFNTSENFDKAASSKINTSSAFNEDSSDQKTGASHCHSEPDIKEFRCQVSTNTKSKTKNIYSNNSDSDKNNENGNIKNSSPVKNAAIVSKQQTDGDIFTGETSGKIQCEANSRQKWPGMSENEKEYYCRKQSTGKTSLNNRNNDEKRKQQRVQNTEYYAYRYLHWPADTSPKRSSGDGKEWEEQRNVNLEQEKSSVESGGDKVAKGYIKNSDSILPCKSESSNDGSRLYKSSENSVSGPENKCHSEMTCRYRIAQEDVRPRTNTKLTDNGEGKRWSTDREWKTLKDRGGTKKRPVSPAETTRGDAATGLRKRERDRKDNFEMKPEVSEHSRYERAESREKETDSRDRSRGRILESRGKATESRAQDNVLRCNARTSRATGFESRARERPRREARGDQSRRTVSSERPNAKDRKRSRSRSRSNEDLMSCFRRGELIIRLASPPRKARRLFALQNRRSRTSGKRFCRQRNKGSSQRVKRSQKMAKGRENITMAKKRRRWDPSDYRTLPDGSLRRRELNISDSETDHPSWKRYEGETKMPYQGYVDSQVQSLLMQLCGEYVEKLCASSSNIEQEFSQAIVKTSGAKQHRGWFLDLKDWVAYGHDDEEKEKEEHDNEEEEKETKEKDDIVKEMKSTSSNTEPELDFIWHTIPVFPDGPRAKEDSSSHIVESESTSKDTPTGDKHVSVDVRKQGTVVHNGGHIGSANPSESNGALSRVGTVNDSGILKPVSQQSTSHASFHPSWPEEHLQANILDGYSLQKNACALRKYTENNCASVQTVSCVSRPTNVMTTAVCFHHDKWDLDTSPSSVNRAETSSGDVEEIRQNCTDTTHKADSITAVLQEMPKEPQENIKAYEKAKLEEAKFSTAETVDGMQEALQSLDSDLSFIKIGPAFSVSTKITDENVSRTAQPISIEKKQREILERHQRTQRGVKNGSECTELKTSYSSADRKKVHGGSNKSCENGSLSSALFEQEMWELALSSSLEAESPDKHEPPGDNVLNGIDVRRGHSTATSSGDHKSATMTASTQDVAIVRPSPRQKADQDERNTSFEEASERARGNTIESRGSATGRAARARRVSQDKEAARTEMASLGDRTSWQVPQLSPTSNNKASTFQQTEQNTNLDAGKADLNPQRLLQAHQQAYELCTNVQRWVSQNRAACSSSSSPYSVSLLATAQSVISATQLATPLRASVKARGSGNRHVLYVNEQPPYVWTRLPCVSKQLSHSTRMPAPIIQQQPHQNTQQQPFQQTSAPESRLKHLPSNSHQQPLSHFSPSLCVQQRFPIQNPNPPPYQETQLQHSNHSAPLQTTTPSAELLPGNIVQYQPHVEQLPCPSFGPTGSVTGVTTLDMRPFHLQSLANDLYAQQSLQQISLHSVRPSYINQQLILVDPKGSRSSEMHRFSSRQDYVGRPATGQHNQQVVVQQELHSQEHKRQKTCQLLQNPTPGMKVPQSSTSSTVRLPWPSNGGMVSLSHLGDPRTPFK